MKNTNKNEGNIHENEIILIINKGPFLSIIIPKKGPIIMIPAICKIPANCKALPFIPIKAPNVLPVLTIKVTDIFIKNEIKANFQYLKVLIT